MPKGPGLTVDQLMEEADPPMRTLANRLRRIIRKALPKSQELVKWRNPTYLFNDKNVAWIMVHRDHVNLGFFRGARMKSPRLEGTGKGFRHIKVSRSEDIDEKEFTRLLVQASALAK
ncbi:MAG: DUF1801 domain-containing protein [Thaumarchaeota archaeon]|nr:DUF1801 domain-containing protein [Nitrososphaerota archaeon]